MVSQGSHSCFDRGEAFRSHDVIDEANLKRCIGTNRTTVEHHSQGLSCTIHTVCVIELTRQTLCTTVTGEEVQVDLWLAEFSVLGCNNV